VEYRLDLSRRDTTTTTRNNDARHVGLLAMFEGKNTGNIWKGLNKS